MDPNHAMLESNCLNMVYGLLKLNLKEARTSGSGELAHRPTQNEGFFITLSLDVYMHGHEKSPHQTLMYIIMSTCTCRRMNVHIK